MASAEKKVQEALVLSEEQFRRAIEEAPIPTIMQAEDGQVLQLSRSWTELTGYSLTDIPTFDNWVTRVVYDRADAVRNHMHELFKGKERSINVEFTVQTRNKGVRVWSFSASSPGTLLDGRRFIIGMAVDITESKKAQHAIKRQATLINLSPDAIMTRKLDGTITFWSDGAEKLYGYSKQEALGQKSQTLLRAKFPFPLSEINAKLNNDRKWEGELYHKAKDGKEVVVQSYWLFEKAEEEEEEEDSILESNVDITERKKAEEAISESEQAAVKYANELKMLQEQLELKTAETEQYATEMEGLAEERAKKLAESERLVAIGTTAGMVGHDIRNPLQSITGEIYIINDNLSELPSSKQKFEMEESVGSIVENISYINKIVADLLDYARPLKPEYSTFDLPKLIRTTIESIAIPNDIKLTIKDETLPAIKSDQTFLRRSINNLVNNAIQAMPKGGYLDLTCSKRENKIFITVSDTGIGIPDNVKDKIFTPMMTTKAKGQGLGLAVVKRLVEALKGTITFESEEGKGTEFIIELPI